MEKNQWFFEVGWEVANKGLNYSNCRLPSGEYVLSREMWRGTRCGVD